MGKTQVAPITQMGVAQVELSKWGVLRGAQ